MTLTPFVAGPLTMMFDSSNAFLRYVRCGDHELIRGVFAAVRDQNWDTVPFSIDDVRMHQSADSFVINFIANSLLPEVAFTWQGVIQGSTDGVVEYHFRGMAAAPFLRNRIGLCVLHPSAACAGKPCFIEHVDGSSTQSAFPIWISPHQPFKNVRSILHRVTTNLHVKVTMSGDTFETEDQRNWTDDSFKTYSTPLDIPFPVQVARMDTIEQSVKIEVLGLESMAISASPSRNQIDASKPKSYRLDTDWERPLYRPKVGFQVLRGQYAPLHRAVTDRLLAIGPDHLRFDIWLNRSDWRSELAIAMELARSVQTQAEIAIFTSGSASDGWRDCLQLLPRLQSQIARVLVFDVDSKSTPSELVRSALDALAQTSPSLPLAAGTNAYFAELNRGRPSLIHGAECRSTQAPKCLVCYSINPQVHAFDNLSLSETLEGQRATVDSAVQIFETDVVISPVTLRPRFNPNATAAIDAELQLVAAIDPRQAEGFGAAWTAGVFASLLTHPKVHSVTLYEAFGRRGIMGSDGQEYPMTNLIQHVLRSEQLFRSRSSHPLELVGLGTLGNDRKKHVVLGNLSSQEISVTILDPSNQSHSVTVAAESVRMVRVEDPNDE